MKQILLSPHFSSLSLSVKLSEILTYPIFEGVSFCRSLCSLWEEAMATHSSTLARKIPWTQEPCRLHSMGSLRVRHDWATQNFHFSLSCIGEENGNQLQGSCLENSRDGGAWWAAVYGVPQSRTWLKWLSSSSNTQSLCAVALVGELNLSRGEYSLAVPWLRHHIPLQCLIPGSGAQIPQAAWHGQNLRNKTLKIQIKGLPSWVSGEESTCQCSGHGFDLWSRKIPHATEQLRLCAMTIEPVL